MANRPVFLPRESGNKFVDTQYVDFEWFAGLSVSQKRKSITSLHDSVEKFLDIKNVLEISSSSVSNLGESLSSFNLFIVTEKNKKSFTVESAFQASKVFEGGGPYVDLLDKTSKEAKKDVRLKESGKLIKFKFYGEDWPLEPKTAFYDWIYINALKKNPSLAEKLKDYSAFTDIEFNPNKSINCQAHSAALYVSLLKRGVLEEALSSSKAYMRLLTENNKDNLEEDQGRLI